MVSDYVLAQAIGAYTSVQMFQAMIGFVIFLIVIGLFSHLVSERKSKKARGLFVDLYVIGKIRQFAKEDGINLDDEMKELRRLERLEKASRKELDGVIEDGLKEKVQASNDKKIEEIYKKS